MRRYPIRILVFLLTFAFGTSFAMLRRESTDISTQSQVGSEFDITLPVAEDESIPCGEYNKSSSIVISIPNDHDIYIGKEKMVLTDIPIKLIPLLKSYCPDQAVFIKVAVFVKFETFMAVFERIRAVCLNGIGVVRIVSKRVK